MTATLTTMARDAIVDRLLAVRRGGALVDPAVEPAGPQSLADAYAIQAGAMAQLGPVGGWKIGRPASHQPSVFAPIPAAAIRTSPVAWPQAESRLRGVELEIAFRIDGPLPSPAAADFMQQLAAIVTPLPVFEILDSRLSDPQNASAAWKLADMQINAGLVCGAPLPGAWQAADFVNPAARLEADGEMLVDGPVTTPGGSPFDLLAELVRICGDHCGGLRPGQIVTTGAFTGMRFFRPGATVTGRIAGSAVLAVTFAA
jgi:2-keto-4-pentenoate hydratase